MKSTTFALGSLMAVAALAQPHLHRHAHKKRDVVWITDIEYTTETVDVTTTIWVSSGFVPPTTSTSEVAASPTSSATHVPAQFFQGASSSSTFSSVYVAPTPSTTSSVYVAPTPSSTYVAPAPQPTTSEAPAYVAPAAAAVETPSTSTPEPVTSTPEPVVYAPETTSAAPVYVAPTTSAAAPAATTASSSSSGSTSGQCSDGSPCSGDITYYTAGLGACGTTTDGDAENVVALPVGMMGDLSNNNPYCGKTITIKCTSTGKTTTATVVDKCMGCKGNSIDLSNKAFLELDDLSVGRTNAEWWFN